MSWSIHPLFKKIFFGFFLCLLLGLGLYRHQERVVLYFEGIRALVSDDYQIEKQLIQPYFDEAFYKKHYAAALKESGLKPIDHYLQRGWRGSWKNHTNPNAWFKTTLYMDRLWYSPSPFYKRKINPFVAYLSTPKIDLKTPHQVWDVYATSPEIIRAWLAVEGLLRFGQNTVVIHLPPHIDKKTIQPFLIQEKRGLKIAYDNHHETSFYQSPFLREFVSKVHHDLPILDQAHRDQMLSRVQDQQTKIQYMWHQLYNPFKWRLHGKIDPTVINIGHYADEPITYSRYGTSEDDFKSYMRSMADGFDLLMLNTKIDHPSCVVIPGYLHGWVNAEELAPTKTFAVSYLLSLGGGSWSSFRDRENLNYALRKDVWDLKNNLALPTQFYLSFRDKHKYPKDMQEHALPTDSKKWIFNNQFNIAIENTRQEDYFTEKLLGCFLSKTIPIYIGCPNIGDYFDTRGMFIAKDVDDIIRICENLTPDTYQKMKPYVEANYQKALAILNLENRILDQFFKKWKGLSTKNL
ncbi:MAG: glycosyltransferase family 10 [Alphaproteobacteria bacterium]|nr:glycosyltransferase family 10 [Alphaproteobacteria bacterium]